MKNEANLCMKQKDEFRCSMVHQHGKPICEFDYSCVSQCILCEECVDEIANIQGEIEEGTGLAAVQKVLV